MGTPNLVPIPADGDWAAVRKAIGVLSRRLGPGGAPHFAGLDVDVLSVDSLTIPGLAGVLQATAGVISGSAPHSALGSIGANDHHNQIHALTGADHTVSGLTAGQVLTALTASTFGFAAPVDLGLSLLTDPGADRILFWDETDNALKWLTISTGLVITGTTLTCTITQYTDALARAALSSTAIGLAYTSATGVFSFTAGYEIPTTVALAAKITNPMTALGDVIIAAADGVPGRLGIGANTYVLTSDGTTAAWAAPSAGTTVHSALSNLAYADAGHTGFEPTVTKGNLTEATSSVLTIASGNGAVIGAGTTIQVKAAATGQSGYLSNTDWNTFNGKMANPMSAAGDLILGGVSGAAGRLAIGADTYVLTSNGTTAAWAAAAAGGSSGDSYGVFQTLLETYRIAGRGITALLDGIVINGLSSGWPNAALSSNTASDATYGFRYPTGGGVSFAYNEWGDYTAIAVGDVADSELRHAQSFTLAGNSLIAGVSLGIYSADGGITDAMTVRIETDTAGSPSGTLAHASFTKAQVPTTLRWNNFTFSGIGDIAQNQDTNNTDSGVGDAAGVEYRGAQSFIPSTDMLVPQVSILMGVKVGTPTGNLTARLETDNAGWPSGTLVHADATKDIAAASVVDSAWNIFVFPSSISLTVGTTYWLVLTCGNQANDNRWKQRVNSAGGYANGRHIRSITGGATWEDYNAGVYDSAFRVYGSAATLAAGTYWVVVSVPAQATGAAYRWSVSRSNPYSGGVFKRSTNGGAWATINANEDGMFKVWGPDTVAVNAVIVSAAIPLSLVPTHCRFLVLYSETNDALTINTDVLLYASRDGGTTFTQLTATAATVDPRWKVAYGVVDISGQPSAQLGSFKVATENNKNVFFHGYAAQWY